MPLSMLEAKHPKALKPFLTCSLVALLQFLLRPIRTFVHCQGTLTVKEVHHHFYGI